MMGTDWRKVGRKFNIVLHEGVSVEEYVNTCLEILYAELQDRMGLEVVNARPKQRGWT